MNSKNFLQSFFIMLGCGIVALFGEATVSLVEMQKAFKGIESINDPRMIEWLQHSSEVDQRRKACTPLNAELAYDSRNVDNLAV